MKRTWFYSLPTRLCRLRNTQISDRLRRAACSFVREKMQYDVQKALVDLGIRTDAFSVDVVITPVTTTDPSTLNDRIRQLNYRKA